MASLSTRWKTPAAMLTGVAATFVLAVATPGVAYATPTDPGAPDKTVEVKSPGKVTCEDLNLGTTLQKVNGARNNKVVPGKGVSSVVKDTDADRDGDPESLFVTVESGTTATAVVAIHGNRAHVYKDSFTAGEHGPFYSPSRSNNTHPPVTDRLICGAAATSPSPSAEPTGSETEAPASPTPTTPGDGSTLPVTGVQATGIGLVGILLLAGGTALVIAGRRRRRTEA